MNRISSLLLAAVTAVSMLAAPASVSAASNSLGVNPRRDYTIKAGEKVSDTLFVTNLSRTEDLVINIDVVDFGPKDETGSPSLLLRQKEPTRWSLKPYLTIAGEQRIAAGKSAEIPFTITIPGNVGAGSFYSAVKYSAGGEEPSENVALASSSATLMFVRVPGDARSSLALEKFGAFTPSKTGESGVFGSLYMGSAPKYLAYRLKNQGNVAEQPSGSIIVRDTFGKQVKLYEDANPNSNVVLIDQTRRFDVCMNAEIENRKDPETGRNIEEVKCNPTNFMPGRYTAQLGLVYGDNGSSNSEIKATATFWYLPVWFLVIMAVVLALIAGLVWFVVRKVRSSRRRGNLRR